jgi:hypothetical protein
VKLLAGLGTGSPTGQHVLSIVMAAQTVSPTPYLVLGPEISFFDQNGTRVNYIHFDQRQVTLATDQSVDYSVAF